MPAQYHIHSFLYYTQQLPYHTQIIRLLSIVSSTYVIVLMHIISNVTRIDRQQKSRINQNVILREARNKNRTANNDRQQRFNRTMFNLKQMKQLASVNLTKMKGNSNYRFKELKNTGLGKKQHASKDDNHKQNIGRQSMKNSTATVVKRYSKMQLQLEEIIKYSKMFPSRRNSILCMNNNISRFMNETQHSAEKSSAPKSSYYSINSMGRTSHPTVTESAGDKGNGSNWKSKLALFNKQGKDRKLSRRGTNTSVTLKDSSLVIDFVKDPGSNNDLQAPKTQKSMASIERFRKKNGMSVTRAHQVPQNQQDIQNMSLDCFIENELEKHRQRNTVNQPLPKQADRLQRNSVRELQKYDNNSFPIFSSKIQEFNQFLSGGDSKESSEFSDFISSQEINQYRQKFSVYRQVYQSAIGSLIDKKIDVRQIDKQDLRSVFFLHWRVKQSNTEENRKAIKQAMKRIKVLD